MKKIYCVYDMKNFEQCVLIAEHVKEIAKFFKRPEGSIYSAVCRKEKIGYRYFVETMNLKELEEPV